MCCLLKMWKIGESFSLLLSICFEIYPCADRMACVRCWSLVNKMLTKFVSISFSKPFLTKVFTTLFFFNGTRIEMQERSNENTLTATLHKTNKYTYTVKVNNIPNSRKEWYCKKHKTKQCVYLRSNQETKIVSIHSFSSSSILWKASTKLPSFFENFNKLLVHPQQKTVWKRWHLIKWRK